MKPKWTDAPGPGDTCRVLYIHNDTGDIVAKANHKCADMPTETAALMSFLRLGGKHLTQIIEHVNGNLTIFVRDTLEGRPEPPNFYCAECDYVFQTSPDKLPWGHKCARDEVDACESYIQGRH